jgi:hypothetical protein
MYCMCCSTGPDGEDPDGEGLMNVLHMRKAGPGESAWSSYCRECSVHSGKKVTALTYCCEEDYH